MGFRVKLSDEDIANFEVLRHVAVATIFWLSIYVGCTLAPPGEYNWTIHVQWRCSLMSNYFVHLCVNLLPLDVVVMLLAYVWGFSERELTFTICYRPSVCLSSVTFVSPTQAVQIFGNISTAFGTLAIHWHPLKVSRRSSQGNPSAGGVKHKRDSQV